MEIKYQSGLPHQQRAVDAIIKVFEDVKFSTPQTLYENPLIDFSDTRIKDNIRFVQSIKDNNVEAGHRKQEMGNNCLNLDIKMETGTGKTYVYTHTIYELHKRYGINKFIVAVPSLSIKEGAKSFLGDEDVKKHFSNCCGYNVEIDLSVLTSKQKRKGKEYFPTEVRKYVSGSNQITNRIYVLLVNMGLLSDRKDGMLEKTYDQAPQSFFQPYDAIKGTRPFVIIDEPHRFSRDQKAYNIIKDKIKPQCLIRFGATFPEITEGKGKNATKQKDYENLIYNLNACQAFNQTLVKGVFKEHFESANKKNEKIRILSIESKTRVHLEHISVNGRSTHILQENDSLSSISSEMNGMLITAIGKDFVEFNNGQIKRKGEEFEVSALAPSYQEAMMRLAIQRHFEEERKNFNRSNKIKTLALFFIDDITSFRGNKDGNGAWLREKFNQLLKKQIEKELTLENSEEYKNFLNSSLQDLNACSAGYFAQDNNDSDEAVAKEVDDILRNKKGLLSFKNLDGTWNLRRFLFSKWTLKEGWDNPNVFTITKLRSSGSEISKIQEVGRGLRLPVDEYGNRLNEEFWLNYIVDFTEADFADKLVAEINADVVSEENTQTISEDQLENAAQKLSIDKITLFIELLKKGYVDTEKKIIIDKTNEFYDEYPYFKPANGVNSTKIRNRNKQSAATVSIRKEQYEELKELWMKINQKYVIFFENELNQKIEKEFHLKDGAFDVMTITSNRSQLNVTEDIAGILNSTGSQYELIGKQIPYNEFLKRINKSTSLPISLIHSKVVEYFKPNTNVAFTSNYINECSLTNFINQFNDWKVENIKGLLNYKQAHYSSKETSLTDVNGYLKKEIAQGLVGDHLDNGMPSTKYLYDGIAYDSDLEKENILTDIDDVVVFGKIPRRSIAIPTIIENYSPDFMYVVKRKDGSKELNIVIETKGVDGKSSLRPTEQAKIDCAKLFFEQLKLDGYEVNFQTQINNKTISQIVKDLIK